MRNEPLQRLVIDGGKSKTDAVIVDASGRELVRASGPGLSIIDTPNGLHEVSASLRELSGQLGVSARFHTVCIGLNGVLGAGPHATEQALRAVKASWTADRYIITSDVVTSFIGAMGFTPGVVIAAGTGAVILALGADGAPHSVDGSGPLFGDRGSGYDVGRQGLDSALRHADGMSGSAALHTEVIGAFGSVRDALSAVYSNDNPAKVIASFSTAVASAALAGDATAIRIWERAAMDLAEGAVAAARAAGLTDTPYAVATTGGLFAVGSMLRDPLAHALRRLDTHARVEQAMAGALAGGTALSLSEQPVLVEVSSWFYDSTPEPDA